MSGGDVRVSDDPLECSLDPEVLTCSLPHESPEEAAQFLEVVGSGGELGAGYRMAQLGVEMPRVRMEYEALVEELVEEVNLRRAEKQSARSIAEFASRRRRQIANQMRMRTGLGTRVLFEVRDWHEYGMGGRTFSNMQRRYKRKKVPAHAINERIIKGALSPNTGLSDTAIRGARFLRHGGRVVFVLSLTTTAYVLLTTPEDQLEQVIYEEAGAAVGGAAGSVLFVGACFVFGIATVGWGLLACGIVGGLAGGAAGTYAGNRTYYLNNPTLEEQLNATGTSSLSQLEVNAGQCLML